MPNIMRQDMDVQEITDKKRKNGNNSPISVSESVSTTTSPRGTKSPRGMKMSILTQDETDNRDHAYRSGDK